MAKTVKEKTVLFDMAIAIRLWTGILLAPIAWGVQLQSVYLSSEYGCFAGNFTWNHILSAIALFAAMIGGAIAWREWNAAGASTEAEGRDRMSRRRFMALIGILGSALFSVTIFAQWLPTLTGVPCGK
jgi:hypothetical protein